MPDLFEFQPVPPAAMPVDSPATTTLRKLIDGCDDDTAAKLLELVRVGLALARRA